MECWRQGSPRRRESPAVLHNSSSWVQPPPGCCYAAVHAAHYRAVWRYCSTFEGGADRRLSGSTSSRHDMSSRWKRCAAWAGWNARDQEDGWGV